MGILRFILAVAVATGHGGTLWGYTVFPASYAVEIFFIISGFLITLVLREKYATLPLRAFYASRLLRIFVPYFFVLALALAAVLPLMAIGGEAPRYVRHIIDAAPTLRASTWAYIVFTNLAIIGQDLGFWLGVEDGQMVFTLHPKLFAQLNGYHLLSQAWTVSLELMFYAMAPFIVRRHILVSIGILAASLTSRIVAARHGLDQGPWSYRFFPFELSLFMFGSVSYRLYAATRTWALWNPVVINVVTAGALGAILLSYDSRFFGNLQLAYGEVALAMPFLFLFDQRFRLNRFLGELSYPVYLIHWPMQSAMLILVGGDLPLALWSVPATIAASVLFVCFVDRPLTRYRHRLTNRSGGAIQAGAIPAISVTQN